MALIQYSEIFDIDGLNKAIKEAETANKEFGTSVEAVNKRVKQSYDEITKELRDYVTVLSNFNVNQKSAAQQIAGTSEEVGKLVKKQQEQKAVIQDVLAANDLLEKSVNDLKTTQKALVAEYNSLGNTEAKDIEYKKQLAQTAQQLTGAIKTQASALTSAKKTVNAAEGSYNKLQQELKEIGQQLKSLPNAFDSVTGKINKNNKEAVALNAKYLQLTTSLKTADSGFGQFFRNVGNYEGALNKFGAGIANLGRNLLATVGITAGLSGLVSFLKDSAAEFDQAEQASSRLENTLKNIGRLDVFERLQAKAQSLAAEFKVFDNDEIVESFQQLVIYGKLSEDQINELIPVIINFAAQQRISLQEAGSVIIKALEGNGKALKEYGINMKDAKSTTEAFGVVMTQLAPKVEGAAKAFGETTAGQIKATEVQIGELKESIGGKLQPVIQKFYEFLNKTFDFLPKLFSSTLFNTEKLKTAVSEWFELRKNILLFDFKGADEVRERQANRLTNQIAQENALSNAEALGTRTLKEQVIAYQQLEQRWQTSKDKVTELSKANQLDTKEGKAATQQLHLQKIQLTELNKVIADTVKNKKAAGDGGVLGFGDPNALFGNAPKTKADDSAAKAAEKERQDQLKALKEYENTRIQINIDALNRIATDESNSSKVRAFAYQKSLDLQIELVHKRANDEIELNQHTGNEILAVREKEKADIIKLQQDETAAIAAIVKKESADKIKAQNDVLNAKSASIKAEVKLESDALDAGIEKRKEAAEKEKQLIEDIFNDLSKSLQAISQVVGNSSADVFFSLSEIIKASVDDGKVSLEQYADLAISVGNAVTDQLNAADEQRIANLEKNKERELTMAGNNAAAQQAINERYAREEAKIKRKEAVNNKINALFQIAINTAVAASKTLGETGIFGIPLLPLIIGLGVAEAALVLAQPLPAYEKGTEYAKEGHALVDEKGTELIIDRHGNLKEVGGSAPRITYLNEGDKVFTATKTKEIFRQIDEQKIMREMSMNVTLSNKIREGRQAEAVYTMAQALKTTGMNNGHLTHAFKEAVKDIPVFQTIIDERGQQARLKKKNETITFLNSYNFGK